MTPKSVKIISAVALAVSFFATSAPVYVGDAAEGEHVFRKCHSCHRVGDDAKNATGPVLNQVIGRTAGTYPDFKYGDDMIAAGAAGLVWDETNIQEYIADPRAFLRTFLDDPSARAKMSFKLRKADDRENVAAYLATLS